MNDWVGMIVETRREMRNGMLIIPAGTKCEVTYARSGLTLEADPCPHCGVQIRVTRVDSADVLALERKAMP